MNFFPLSKRIHVAAHYYAKQVRRIYRWKTSNYYLVSFPKSGRTWVRILLARYFSLHFNIHVRESFTGMGKECHGLPKISFTHHGFYGGIVHKSRKGYISADKLKKSIRELAGKPIILLVRDPRDVVISHYFSSLKRSSNEKLTKRTEELGISGFIRDEELGIRNIIRYMNAWYEARNTFSDFFLIRYRDCRSEPERFFAELIDFLGVSPVDQGKLRSAIEYASFDNMRSMEMKDDRDPSMRPGDTKDPESFKTRKGKVGGYVDYLSGEDLEYVNKQMELLNPDFGYMNFGKSYSGN